MQSSTGTAKQERNAHCCYDDKADPQARILVSLAQCKHCNALAFPRPVLLTAQRNFFACSRRCAPQTQSSQQEKIRHSNHGSQGCGLKCGWAPDKDFVNKSAGFVKVGTRVERCFLPFELKSVNKCMQTALERRDRTEATGSPSGPQLRRRHTGENLRNQRHRKRHCRTKSSKPLEWHGTTLRRQGTSRPKHKSKKVDDLADCVKTSHSWQSAAGKPEDWPAKAH